MKGVRGVLTVQRIVGEGVLRREYEIGRVYGRQRESNLGNGKVESEEEESGEARKKHFTRTGEGGVGNPRVVPGR